MNIDIRYYEQAWYDNCGDVEGIIINQFTDEQYLMLYDPE